ncbi:hypothetical protein [Streptococcus sobrinus]|uniref:hypothetical protein n=3 Tax=Streptococcus sobrinus TaxID=1310 RepID=UPI000369CF38|nr:hypothetical protein [Streptococcus sobrinus]
MFAACLELPFLLLFIPLILLGFFPLVLLLFCSFLSGKILLSICVVRLYFRLFQPFKVPLRESKRILKQEFAKYRKIMVQEFAEEKKKQKFNIQESEFLQKILKDLQIALTIQLVGLGSLIIFHSLFLELLVMKLSLTLRRQYKSFPLCYQSWLFR